MILACDLGTSGNKATLHQADGRLVDSQFEPYATRYGDGGVVEQDPEDWWASTVAAVGTLLARAGLRAEEIDGIGFSGQMMGAVLLDSSYRPVRPAIIWADTRSTAEAEHLLGVLDPDDAYRQLGHRINPTYSLTKIMWVRDHEPRTFAQVAHVCNAKDYVVWRMTGRLVTDPSDASSTNAFDQSIGHWSEAILGAAGIDPQLFPPVVESTTVVGGLRPDAAEATGLPVGTPVVLGGGDGPMAAAGAGVCQPSDGAYVSLGTSSWVSLASTTPLHDPGKATMTFNHVVPDMFVPTATMQAGGASVEWIASILDDELAIDTWSVASEPAADRGVYFLPYLLGERSPYWDPAARGAFVGMSRSDDRTVLARAVLEGVGFNLYTCIQAFRGLGVEIDRVVAIGGGARSDTWLQILADQWNCVVDRSTSPHVGNSLGAAITTGVAIGQLSDFNAARQLLEISARFEPRDDLHQAYRQQHRRFVAAYEALAPWFAEEHR